MVVILAVYMSTQLGQSTAKSEQWSGSLTPPATQLWLGEPVPHQTACWGYQLSIYCCWWREGRASCCQLAPSSAHGQPGGEIWVPGVINYYLRTPQDALPSHFKLNKHMENCVSASLFVSGLIKSDLYPLVILLVLGHNDYNCSIYYYVCK